MGRSTQGVRLVALKEENDLVVAAQKIEAVAEVEEISPPSPPTV
jgi:hypothetical protein